MAVIFLSSPIAMPALNRINRTALACLLLIGVLCVLLYATLGAHKPVEHWKWMDIVSEGGTSLMSALWVLLILGSRPGGRVTWLLVGGLAAITLGTWADCMDEFFIIPKEQYWDNWLEALTPIGMLTLTFGLYFWRQEQFSLNEHMQKRERLFRDHRSFDRVTQLANADYLRRQIRLEQKRDPEQPTALVLLDINHFHLVNREHGAREGDRLLQAITHLLLLNLRPQDLLCRYAGDRFAILLPNTEAAAAHDTAAHLRKAVATLAHHTREGARIPLTARAVCAQAGSNTDTLLAELNAALETAPLNMTAAGFA
jgi:diguanylate cyclase (GGDEF)-like protein